LETFQLDSHTIILDAMEVRILCTNVIEIQLKVKDVAMQQEYTVVSGAIFFMPRQFFDFCMSYCYHEVIFKARFI